MTLPVPEEYRFSLQQGNMAFAGFYPMYFLSHVTPDTVVAGYMGIDRLSVLDREGVPVAEHPVPVLFRKGLASDLWRVFAENTWAVDSGPWEAGSSLNGLGSLSDGRVVTIHIESRLEGGETGRTVDGTMYVSLLSLDGGPSCVDLRVDAGGDDRAMATVHADTLYVLDRRISPTDELEPWVLRFPLVGTPCPEQHVWQGDGPTGR